jgi:DNA-binding MarR family transcriptional regulator
MNDAVDTILDQWATERPDLDRAPMGVVGRIARLAKAHSAVHAQTFAAFGLQPDEFDVLATLRRHGRPYALNPKELMLTMMVASGTMTHRFDKLERAGLITRTADPEDRRGVVVTLTAAGRKVIDKAVTAHVESERALLAVLTPAEQTRLADLLRRLCVQAEAPRVGP